MHGQQNIKTVHTFRNERWLWTYSRWIQFTLVSIHKLYRVRNHSTKVCQYKIMLRRSEVQSSRYSDQATSWTAEESWFDSWAGEKKFCLLQIVQQKVSGVHPAMGNVDSFPGLKRQGPWSWSFTYLNLTSRLRICGVYLHSRMCLHDVHRDFCLYTEV